MVAITIKEEYFQGSSYSDFILYHLSKQVTNDKTRPEVHMFLHDRPGYDKEEDLAKVGEDDRIDHIGLLSDKGETTGNIVSAKLSAIYVPEPEDEAIP